MFLTFALPSVLPYSEGVILTVSISNFYESALYHRIDMRVTCTQKAHYHWEKVIDIQQVPVITWSTWSNERSGVIEIGWRYV